MDVLAIDVAMGRYGIARPQSLVTYLAQLSDTQAVAVTGEGSYVNVRFVAPKGGLEPTASIALLEMLHTPELAASIQEVLALHRQFQPSPD